MNQAPRDPVPRKIHILGVGGTAMAAIAGLFRELQCEVRGSDASRPFPPMGPLLDELQIPVLEPYAPENLDWGPDLVVVGNVIRRTNPEAQSLLARQIPYLSMPAALSRYFLTGRRPVVIAGTHGKTTTSSLVAHLLAAQGFDPGFLIGGIPLNFARNSRLGSGPYFVVEGDEYDTAFFDKGPKFLHYQPQAAIILNIEFDHADIFQDLDAVVAAFASFAGIVPPQAPLLVPAESTTCARAVSRCSARVVTFGSASGTWQVRDARADAGGFRFSLIHEGHPVGEFQSPLIGEHNLHDTLAALALVHEIGAATPALPAALASFRGVRKRQELIGVARGVRVYDDFAHHPTAVRETLKAFRSAFRGARLIALFEPESNTSRRRVFQREYADAFSEADAVLFSRPLEKPDHLAPHERIDMERLCRDIAERGVPARMIEDIAELAREAASLARPGDLIIGMSGRDFYGVHRLVLEHLRSDQRD